MSTLAIFFKNIFCILMWINIRPVNYEKNLINYNFELIMDE